MPTRMTSTEWRNVRNALDKELVAITSVCTVLDTWVISAIDISSVVSPVALAVFVMFNVDTLASLLLSVVRDTRLSQCDKVLCNEDINSSPVGQSMLCKKILLSF
ncbi:hypothetical protein AcV5_000078 [Taiwanofungus camphoratus]|nr:hypothetical protein AcV5_000078 [Antrodia cinnamomea]